MIMWMMIVTNIYTFFLSGSMLDVIKHQKKKGHCEDGILDESVIASVLREVLKGLNYFHSQGLIHRSVASIFVK